MNKYKVKVAYDIAHAFEQSIYAQTEEDTRDIALLLARKALTDRCVNLRVVGVDSDN